MMAEQVDLDELEGWMPEMVRRERLIPLIAELRAARAQNVIMSAERINELDAENAELRGLLAEAIIWIGAQPCPCGLATSDHREHWWTMGRDTLLAKLKEMK